jgi:hypothetical protein
MCIVVQVGAMLVFKPKLRDTAEQTKHAQQTSQMTQSIVCVGMQEEPARKIAHL